ncbi:Ig-like domain-containing protein [Anabaenopsis sp. FSS-46]|uniref:Ig-like domain-containing protein n=1 Tax=Anabaenopsis sp. FSS-46 TaxID=2971766 RepID=UPI00247506D8|nr:Ig-like domain-containing protein [Anabaenopsis sp. FSS-46]MDH6097658.1 Ig-like domain-containing protein [Anabaenopsis sp. FSS-46]
MANLIITPVSVDIDDNSSEFILNYRLENFTDPRVSSVGLTLYYNSSQITINPNNIQIPFPSTGINDSSFNVGNQDSLDGDNDPSTTDGIFITINNLNASAVSNVFARVPFQVVGGAFDPQVGTKVNFVVTTGNASITVNPIPSVTIANLPVTNQSTSVAYRTIADAIAAANAGDTIQVASGTYAESFTINKAITLIGPNQGTAATASTRANDARIDGKVTIAANNVTINGFRLDHANGPLAWEGTPDNFQLLNSSVTGYTAANAPRFGDANNYNGPQLVTGWNITGNYIGDMSGEGTSGALYLAGLNNSDISNNIFDRPQAAHLYLSSLTDVRIENNTFNNGVNDGNLYYSGYWFEIKGTNDGVLIKGNSGQGNSGGIQLWGEQSSNFKFDNITIEGNTFENFVNADRDGSGIAGNRSGTTPAIVASASVENGHSGSNLVIRDNTITKDLGTLLNNTDQSRDLPHLIDIRGAFNGVTIQGNNLAYTGATTNNFPLATGLSLTGSLPGAVNVSNNQFSGGDGATQPTSYYAIDLQPVFVNANQTQNPGKYGTFAGNLNITGNTISDWQAGVVLRNTAPITGVNIAGNTFSNNLSNVFDGIAPTITAGQSFTYQENQDPGFVVGTVAASDNLNNTDNVGIRDYAIVSGNGNGFFSINSSSGEISLTAAGVASAANDFESTPNTFTLGITATDAGNLSTTTDVTITVTDDPTDTIVATPTINTIAANDIVNFSEADAGFNITGTGIPAAIVSLVFDSGRVLAGGNTVTVGVNGTWSVNVTFDDVDVFDQGTEVVTATQRLNGIDSASVTKQFTVDTVEPTVSIASNAPEIATSPITYTFTFSEAVTGFTADDITVTNGTKGTFTQVSGTVYTLAVNPNANFDGELTVAVAGEAAQDAAGNPSLAPQPVVQRVDTLIPAAPTINPIAGDNIVNSVEAGGFAIIGTGEVGAQVTLSFSRGIADKTVQVDGNGTWSVNVTAADVTAFGEGSKTITATQTDLAGNVSPTVTQAFTVDTVRPLTPFINVISGNDIVNATEATAGFNIRGTGEAGATLTLSFSSGRTLASGNTLVVPADGNWSVPVTAADVTAFGQGTETITARQTDPAGNVSLTYSRSITVDTELPFKPVINTIAGNDIVNATEATAGFTIRGTGEAGATLTLSFSSGDIANKTVLVPANNSWSIALTPPEITALGEGQKVITATQTDAVGNRSQEATRTITVDTGAPPAPTIGNITPDNIVNAAESAGFNITGTGEAGARVTLIFNSNRVLLGGNTAIVGADGNWSIPVQPADVTAFGEGAEIITATQTDVAGNISQPATLPFTVDTVAPGAITIDAIAGDNIVNAAEAQAGLNITGTGENGATVTLTTGTASRTAVVTDGIWSISVTEAEITGLGQGDIEITGTQTDRAGNTSSVITSTITLATQPPGAPGINEIAGDNIVNVDESQTGFNITGTGQPGAIVNLSLDSGRVLQAGNTVTVADDGTWSIPIFTADITAFGQGTETITATQTDIAGNTSDPANLTFTVDTLVLITAADQNIAARLQAASAQSATVDAAGMTEAQLASLVANLAKIRDGGITNLSLNNGNTLGTINGLLSSRTVAAGTVTINASDIGSNILSAIATNINKVSSLTNLALSNSDTAGTIGTLLRSNAVAVNSVSVNAEGMNQGQRQSLANAIGKVSNLTNLSLSNSDTASLITTLLGSAAVASDSVAVNASGMNSAKLTAVANQVAKVSTLTDLTLTNANTGDTANATVITNLLSAAADSSVSVSTQAMGTGKLSAIENNFRKVSSAVIGDGQTLTLAADTVNNATINGDGTLALTGSIQSDTFFTNIRSGTINLTQATLGFNGLTLRNSSEYVLTLSQSRDLIANGTSARDLLTIDLSNVDFDEAEIFQAGSETYGPFITLSGLQVNTAEGPDEVSFKFPVSDDPTSQKLLLRNGFLDLGLGFDDTIRISGGEVWYTTADFSPGNYERVIINSVGNFTLAAFRQLLAAGFVLSGDGVYVVRGGIGEAADPNDPFSESDPGGAIDLTGIGQNFEAGGVDFPTIQFVDLTQADIRTAENPTGLLILPTATDRPVVLKVGDLEVYRPDIILTDITVFTAQQLIEAVTGENAGDLTSITLGANITLSQNLGIPNTTSLNFANNTLLVANGATLTLTTAQASGAAIAGQGTVVLTNPGDNLTADLSDINVSEVRLAVDASLNVTAATLVQTLTFDVTGSGNLTLTAAQASDRSITNAGQVTITGLGSDEVDLSGITGAGTATASLSAPSVTLAGDTNLGNVAVTLADQSLTLSAAQASGKTITGAGAVTVTVTGLTATTNLSGLSAGLNVTATVTATTDISGNNNLGTVDTFQVDAGTLTLRAAQATGKSITGTGAVTVTGVNATTDLSRVSTGLNVTATVTATTDISTNNNLGTVPFQVDAGTLTLSAAQASGRSITGIGAVTVTGLTATTNLSGLSAGLNVTATVTADTNISANTNLGTVDTFAVGSQSLTLSAAQASAKTITGTGAVTVTGLTATTNLSELADTLAVTATVTADTNISANTNLASVDTFAVGSQSLTLSAAQSSGKTITGTGAVTVTGLTATTNLLGLADTLAVTATVTAATDISANNNLGTVDRFTVNAGQSLTLSGTQTSGKTITGTGTVTVAGLATSTDLSGLGDDLNVTAIVKTVEDLTSFDISAINALEVEPSQELTLTAAQTSGKSITGNGTLRIVDLADFPTPNLSQIADSVTVIVDGTAVSINTPGDTLLNAGESAATSISGSAIGAEGQTVTVVFTDSNGNQVISTATVANDAWTVISNLSSLGEGVIGVTATSEDIAGNPLSADAPALLTLDFTPPVAPIINPVTGDNAVNATEAAAGFTITGTGEEGATVTLTLGGTNIGTAVVEEGGNWSLDIAPGQLTGQETRNLVAFQTDAAGNIGAEQSQELLIRTSAIAVAITSIGSADSVVSGVAGDNTVVGTAQPGNVIILLGQQVLGVATADANGNFTYSLSAANLTAIGQGTNKTITATQTDAAGNIGTSAPFTFAVDTIAPTVAITSSLAAGAIATGDPITYTFTFSEAVINFTIDDITVTNGIKGAFTPSSTSVYTLVVTPQADFAGDLTVAVAAASAQDTAGNLSPSAETVVPVDTVIAGETFKVTNFDQNASGFVLTFNDDLNLSVLNLYRGIDIANPLAPVTDSPDLTLRDGTGTIIKGSLIWDEGNADTLTFVKTGDILAPGNYTLTLESRSDGFVSSGGRLLDGNEDGLSGGNFVRQFTVDSPTVPVLTLPDFSRGPDQEVNIRGGGQFNPLPIRISNPGGLENISFTLQYDPDLLAITGANVAAAGWTTTSSDLNSTPGQAQFTLTGPALNASTDLITLNAQVRDTATYGAKGVLQILPGAGLIGDSAVQLVALLGDTTKTESYFAADASLISRVNVGLDTGFRAFPVTDPLIIGDATGNGILDSGDATSVRRASVGLSSLLPPLV